MRGQFNGPPLSETVTALWRAQPPPTGHRLVGGWCSVILARSDQRAVRVCPSKGKPHWFDIPIAGPLLSSTMSVIAQAIADRQGEIDRLQAEIKALTDVEQLLGASAPAPRSALRRSSPRKATATSTESQPEAKPQRKRREMTAAEKKAVSERMTAYWAGRRKKAPKKKAPKK